MSFRVTENWYLSHRLERILHIADGGSKEVKAVLDKILDCNLVCLLHLVTSNANINLAGIFPSNSLLCFTGHFMDQWRVWFKGIHPSCYLTLRYQTMTLLCTTEQSS
jgi:hypothetical protein